MPFFLAASGFQHTELWLAPLYQNEEYLLLPKKNSAFASSYYIFHTTLENTTPFDYQNPLTKYMLKYTVKIAILLRSRKKFQMIFMNNPFTCLRMILLYYLKKKSHSHRQHFLVFPFHIKEMVHLRPCPYQNPQMHHVLSFIKNPV